jgi:hypothetical protein
VIFFLSSHIRRFFILINRYALSATYNNSANGLSKIFYFASFRTTGMWVMCVYERKYPTAGEEKSLSGRAQVQCPLRFSALTRGSQTLRVRWNSDDEVAGPRSVTCRGMPPGLTVTRTKTCSVGPRTRDRTLTMENTHSWMENPGPIGNFSLIFTDDPIQKYAQLRV